VKKSQGVALLATLLAALALLVIVVVVVGSLTTSNRRISGDQSVELQAQYAAESGAENIDRLYEEIRTLFNSLEVDLSSGGDEAAYRFASRIYSFCYGVDPDQVPHSQLDPIYEALQGEHDYHCSVDPDQLASDIEEKTAEELGKTYLRVLVDYIPESVYEELGIDNPAQYWGEVLKGTQANMQATLYEDETRKVRYRLSTGGPGGITPNRVAIQQGAAGGDEEEDNGVTFHFGDPSNEGVLYAIGEVVDPSGRLLAQRRIQIGNESQYLLSLTIIAPSFAWFAFFYDHQPDESDPFKMIAFSSNTLIDGPVHSNDYLAFEEGSTPWFGGPVSSAGPQYRNGEVGFYWRDPNTLESGFETMPPGTDPEHWWELEHADPNFAIAKNPMGKELCYNPETGVEETCEDVDEDGDGEPDPPWTYKRLVNWDHNVIDMPTENALEDIEAMAEEAGILLKGDVFCGTGDWATVPQGGRKPDRCVGKYKLRSGLVTLEAVDGKQRMTIEAQKVLDWEYHHSYCTCQCPDDGGGGGGGGGDDGGGGIIHRLPQPLEELALAYLGQKFPTLAHWIVLAQGTRASSSCDDCPSNCSCNCYDAYHIVLRRDSLVFEYTEDDPYLNLVYEDGEPEFVEYNTTVPFNGVVFAQTKFNVAGPWDETDPPKPAIAEFAQITLASSDDLHIMNDMVYEDPACTKTPQLVDTDGDGVPDTAVDRCTPEDFENASPNLLGVYAKNIWLDPAAGWNDPNDNLEIHGILMAYQGKVSTLQAQNAPDYGRFKLLGGIIQKEIGMIGYRDDEGNLHGYRTSLVYDQRMLDGTSPPGFPTFMEGNWKTRNQDIQTGSRGFWRQAR